IPLISLCIVCQLIQIKWISCQPGSNHKKTGTDVLAGAADKVEELGDFVVCHATNADSEIQVHREISPNFDSKCYEVESNQDSPDLSLPPISEDSLQFCIA
ncbi:hypothetical protein KIW84_045111, partial [Lathyrus oleraceus]